MHLSLLKAKIHRAVVTHCELHYEGSAAIDGQLLEAAQILPYEQVHIWNVTTGARFTTYAIAAPAGSRIVSLNGSAARLAAPGDLIIVATFAQLSVEEAVSFRPRQVYVDGQNQLTQIFPNDSAQAA